MKITLLFLTLAVFVGVAFAGHFPRRYKHVFGYLTHKHFLDYDFDAAFNLGISDLIFFGLEINKLGNPSDRSRKRLPTHETARRAKEAAHKTGGRTIFSLGSTMKKPTKGQEDNFQGQIQNPYAEVVSKVELRQNYINTVKTIMAEYNFDGVNVHWEFPETPAEIEGYATLIKELRKAIPESLILVSVGEDQVEGFVKNRIHDHVDYLMTFTFPKDDRFYGTHGTALGILNSLRVDYRVPTSKIIVGCSLWSLSTKEGKKLTYAEVLPRLDNDSQVDLEPDIRVSNRVAIGHLGVLSEGYKTSGVFLFELGYDLQPVSDNRSLTSALFDRSGYLEDMPEPEEWFPDEM